MNPMEKEEGSGVSATVDKIQRENNIPKNASESDFTYTTNFEMQQQNSSGGSLARRENAGSSEPSSKPNKPSLLNPNKNNNTNNNNNDKNAGESAKPAGTDATTMTTTDAKQRDTASPSRRESGRLKSLHVQRATLDAEAKARALKFTCSLFPRANIRVKYLGMVDEKIAEQMDVEKLAKEHYKEGGNVHPTSSNTNNTSSNDEEKNEMLKPLGYRCEGTLFSEPFEATIDESGYHFVRWGAEGEGRRVVETPCSTSTSQKAEETSEKQQQQQQQPETSNNDSSETTTTTTTANKKGLLDVDEAVKCIVEEIARRFENKIPGMKPSSSSSLKLNTGNSNNNNNGNGGRLCSNCGAGSNSTPLMRRGPDGVRSLCNACGLWYARRGTQRPIEGGSVAEREAKAAKETMAAAAAAGEEQGGDGEFNKRTKEEEDEAKRQLEKEIEEKEKLARIVPKIESLNGFAVFGYHEHIVQDALRAHIIAKYAPSMGMDVLMAAGMHKYGRYETSFMLSNGGKNQPAQQRRSSKRERKEITKFVDVAYTNAPQKRKTNASSKTAAKRLKAQQASEEKAAKKAATASAGASAGGGAVTKKVGMRKNASDRSMADQFFGLNDSFHERPISSNNNNQNVQQEQRQPTAAEDLQSWENVLFSNGFGGEPLYTNIIPGNQQRHQEHHQSNTMYISQQQQIMRGGSGELRGFSPPNNISNISNANIINNNVPNPGNFRIDDDLLGLDALMDNHESFIDGNMF